MNALRAFLLVAALIFPLVAAAQYTVTAAPNPATEGERVRLNITGTVAPFATRSAPLVVLQPGIVNVYLYRSCGEMTCPPSVPIDIVVPLPLLLPGSYDVRVYQGSPQMPAVNIPALDFARTSLLIVPGQDAPACVTGLWWNAPAGSESGWGLSLDQQGSIVFAVWFTYDADGRATWFVMPRAERTASGAYAGPIYRTRGPAFDAVPWNSAGVGTTPAGSGTLTFSGEAAGTFSYTVDGRSGTKSIVRQVFGSPVSRCTVE